MNNFRSSVQRGAGLGAIMALLGGCAVGPDFVRPAPPDTDRYTSEPRPETTVAADGNAQHFMSGAEIAADWWRLFQSAPLDAVVRQALSNNPTLQAARPACVRVRTTCVPVMACTSRKARLEYRQPAALRCAVGAIRLPTSGTVFNLFTASGTISYTLDVFGGKRRTVEGLRARPTPSVTRAKRPT